MPSDEQPFDAAGPSRDRTTVSLAAIFSLRSGTDYDGTMRRVRASIEPRGGNAWALVFAILIASIGLNVNSTAVIIGAMLISPLMGPITASGFALATNDLALLRAALRNLAIATVIALVTSVLYFSVTPLADVQSELLARTRPTIYDVLIALVGGSAGAVAITRKQDMGTLAAGVAIATALMPPLCTAGYGLATGHWDFVLGALHLFLINALFIALATLGFAKLMRFRRTVEPGVAHIARTRLVLALLTGAIMVPSLWTAWNVVHEARFERSARRFVEEQLVAADRAVLSTDLSYDRRGSTITVTILGRPLTTADSLTLGTRLAEYGLAGDELVFRQPLQGGAGTPLSATPEAGLRSLEGELARRRQEEAELATVARELAALHPQLHSLALGREVRADSAATVTDGTDLAVATWRTLPSTTDQQRMESFLRQRLGKRSLRLVHVEGR